MTFLLDVNLLLALCDPRHVHHGAAHLWFAATPRRAWATCPITENAFIRIASHARYPNSPGTASTTAGILSRFCASGGHSFWPDDVRLIDPTVFSLAGSVSSSQTTDVYLLGLASRHRGKLATLDRSIPARAVVGGEAALEVLSA